MGPTASGKTVLAERLVDEAEIPFEIISVDSALVYRGMDIGTAKPKNIANQHLIDIRDPADTYSVADFRADALELMYDISGRNKVPLLVGGSMLYFKALRDGLATLPAADSDVRNEILQLAREKGWQAVHARLAKVDAEAAERINPADSQRLQRALEVYELTGRSLTQWHLENTNSCPFRLAQIGLMPLRRKDLHARIEARFMAMLGDGLVEEVKQFYQRDDLSADLPSMKAVGYRQIWAYLDGRTNYEEMVNKCLAATRQLAKRQMTWMRGWKDLVFQECKPYADFGLVLKYINSDIILE